MPDTVMRNARKAAILLVSVEDDLAALLLSKLDKTYVEAIMREVAQLRNVGKEDRDAAIEEFYRVALARNIQDSGGMNTAKALLAKTFKKD